MSAVEVAVAVRPGIAQRARAGWTSGRRCRRSTRRRHPVGPGCAPAGRRTAAAAAWSAPSAAARGSPVARRSAPAWPASQSSARHSSPAAASWRVSSRPSERSAGGEHQPGHQPQQLRGGGVGEQHVERVLAVGAGRPAGRGVGLPAAGGGGPGVPDPRVRDDQDAVPGRVDLPAEVEVVAEDRQLGVEAADRVPHVAPDQRAGGADGEHVLDLVVLALVVLAPLQPGLAVAGCVGGEPDLDQHPGVVPVADLGAEQRGRGAELDLLDQLGEGGRLDRHVVVQEPDPGVSWRRGARGRRRPRRRSRSRGAGRARRRTARPAAPRCRRCCRCRRRRPARGRACCGGGPRSPRAARPSRRGRPVRPSRRRRPSWAPAGAARPARLVTTGRLVRRRDDLLGTRWHGPSQPSRRTCSTAGAVSRPCA